MELTTLDIGLVFLIGAGGFWGIRAGAVRLVGPFALILALITLVQVYPNISARFETAPPIHFFLMLLMLAFVGLLLSGFVIRALQAAVHVSGLGAINLFAGALLGVLTGTVVSAAIVWWLQTHGGPQLKSLLTGSALTPALLEFFHTIISFSERLLPTIEPRPKEPWWKRGLW